jgi:predicted nucleic acid-binding Zn finger protein
MCDEDLLSLENILLSVPRREVKIILERAEYIFPALKDGLVSVFVFVGTAKKNCKYVLPEN